MALARAWTSSTVGTKRFFARPHHGRRHGGVLQRGRDGHLLGRRARRGDADGEATRGRHQGHDGVGGGLRPGRIGRVVSDSLAAAMALNRAEGKVGIIGRCVSTLRSSTRRRSRWRRTSTSDGPQRQPALAAGQRRTTGPSRRRRAHHRTADHPERSSSHGARAKHQAARGGRARHGGRPRQRVLDRLPGVRPNRGGPSGAAVEAGVPAGRRSPSKTTTSRPGPIKSDRRHLRPRARVFAPSRCTKEPPRPSGLGGSVELLGLTQPAGRAAQLGASFPCSGPRLPCRHDRR